LPRRLTQSGTKTSRCLLTPATALVSSPRSLASSAASASASPILWASLWRVLCTDPSPSLPHTRQVRPRRTTRTRCFTRRLSCRTPRVFSPPTEVRLSAHILRFFVLQNGLFFRGNACISVIKASLCCFHVGTTNINHSGVKLIGLQHFVTPFSLLNF